MDAFETDEMISDDNIPLTSKRLRGTLENPIEFPKGGNNQDSIQFPDEGNTIRENPNVSNEDEFPQSEIEYLRFHLPEPSFVVNNRTVIKLHGIKDSNYKNGLRKMVAKLTDEEKIIIINVDDVFISGTIDYNKEDDCMGGWTYEENKIIPAVAKRSTTNFDMLL
uniref:Uncharacterized protein n=1 Tax=Glossina austeni TaxID=7395 RepID=A0A1A9VI86_GLOAU